MVCVKLFKDMESSCETSFRVELNVGYAEFDHPSILKLRGAGRNHVMKNNLSMGEKYFIVSDLAPNGDLFEFLNASGTFNELLVK